MTDNGGKRRGGRAQAAEEARLIQTRRMASIAGLAAGIAYEFIHALNEDAGGTGSSICLGRCCSVRPRRPAKTGPRKPAGAVSIENSAGFTRTWRPGIIGF